MPVSRERAKVLRSPEWKAQRARILERAGHRCEGSPLYPGCRAENYKPHPVTGSKVVLTIAHVEQDLTKNDDADLRAWCQKCHNAHDAKQRAHNATITRAEKVGQPDFYGRK